MLMKDGHLRAALRAGGAVEYRSQEKSRARRKGLLVLSVFAGLAALLALANPPARLAALTASVGDAPARPPVAEAVLAQAAPAAEPDAKPQSADMLLQKFQAWAQDQESQQGPAQDKPAAQAETPQPETAVAAEPPPVQVVTSAPEAAPPAAVPAPAQAKASPKAARAAARNAQAQLQPQLPRSTEAKGAQPRRAQAKQADHWPIPDGPAQQAAQPSLLEMLGIRN